MRVSGSTIVQEELTGSKRVLAMNAASLIDARLENAPEVLHTHYTKEHGAVLLTAELEDRRTRRITPLVAASAGTVLAQSDALAHKLDPQAHAFSTSNEAAIEAFGNGDYEKAIMLDPDFGAAWFSRVAEMARAGKKDEAAKIADQALARKTLRTEWWREQLLTQAAVIRRDFSGLANGLTDLANAAPGDASALSAAANAQLLARNFPAAAELFRKLSLLTPSSPVALNSLGYAEGFSGNIDAAAKAFQEYGKLPGSAYNAIDSLGEVYFMNGRFSQAESEFLKNAGDDPKFVQNGTPAVKAAYAHWLAGDLAGADAMMQKLVTPMSKVNAPLALWRQATWLYATGRQDQAIGMLMHASTELHGDARIQHQLLLWQNVSRLPTYLDKLRTAYFATPPGQDSVERVLYGAALAAAGKDADAKPVLARWPVPEASRQPEFDSVIFPKYLELRKKLQLK